MNKKIPLRIDFEKVAQSNLNFFDYIHSIEEQKRDLGFTIEAIVLPLEGATIFGLPVFSSDHEYQEWKEEKEQAEKNARRALPYN